MIWMTDFNRDNPDQSFNDLLNAWDCKSNRVFVLKNGAEPNEVRDFYTQWFSRIGEPAAIAEDAAIGDRGNQRTGDIWTEVRYDPKFPNAYRHSANAQPLHTDGSYIPDFPSATLMVCVANAGNGGETTFISSDDVISSLSIEQADLLSDLSTKKVSHTRSGDVRVEKIIDCSGEIPQLNWNYYCLDDANSADIKSTTDAFFNFLGTSKNIELKTMAVKLAPGDAILWKDREVLHGRRAFEASHESERFLWKCAIDVGQFHS